MLKRGSWAFSSGHLALAGIAVIPLGLLAGFQSKGQPAKPPTSAALKKSFDTSIAPITKKYCSGCHAGKDAPGKFETANVKTFAAVQAAGSAWSKAAGRVTAKTMPPAGMPQPTAAERKAFAAAAKSIVAATPKRTADPGRVTLRRLNRAEYDNTIRDLFYGLESDFGKDFPSDDVGYGFDNIGDVLSLSPLLMEKYLDAAEAIAAKAIALPLVRTMKFSDERLNTDTGNQRGDGVINLFSAGQVWATHEVPLTGQYRVRFFAFANQAGPEPAKLEVRVGNRKVGVFDVKAENEPAVYEMPLELNAGRLRLAGAFINDYYQPNDPNPRNRDRNLYIQAIELHGPLNVSQQLPKSHQKIMVVPADSRDPMPAARRILGAFAQRAYRRPVTKDEVEALAKFVPLAMKEGEPFERGIQLGITAALVSPKFLYRFELDPSPGTRPLNGYEIANRLSYFLWSSMPDDELFKLASEGKLAQPDVVAAQARRMLADPKASALTENFAGQWLQLRKLETMSPDPELFPEFNEALRKDMIEESLRFFDHVVRQDQPIADFLDANYTFLNGRLARHYGISGIQGEQWQRVTLANRRRGGLMMQGSILTVTSNPNRTSPVKRGKWVMEQILGTPPPPPPPDVGTLEGDTDKTPSKTIKERLERHRRDPKCSVCHLKMDTIGFAFENYDPIGKWRTADGPFPIDAAGKLPEGKAFKNAVELRSILAAEKPAFARAFAEKLLTYALGRGLSPSDDPTLDQLRDAAIKGNYRFSALLRGIVTSEPFLKRRSVR
jgi:hypothetical protein